jgi:hypothetical protein
LLHDIGKVAVNGRVRLIDRAAKVVLARVSPQLLSWLARLPAPRWRRGLALAVHHPRLGAARAADLGCSPRACWLIAHHEDEPAPEDDALTMLCRVDDRVL